MGRTVDKIWGTGQEVTMFSVKDPFTNALDGQDGLMWVDESGQTEDAECSSRGLCNNEDGVCECFASRPLLELSRICAAARADRPWQRRARGIHVQHPCSTSMFNIQTEGV